MTQRRPTPNELRRLVELFSVAIAWGSFLIVPVALFGSWASRSHPRLDHLLGSGTAESLLDPVVSVAVFALALVGVLTVQALGDPVPCWSKESTLAVAVMLVAVGVGTLLTGSVQNSSSGGFVPSPQELSYGLVVLLPVGLVAPLFGAWVTTKALLSRVRWLATAWVVAWAVLLAVSIVEFGFDRAAVLEFLGPPAIVASLVGFVGLRLWLLNRPDSTARW
jgi:hypothetical protein